MEKQFDRPWFAHLVGCTFVDHPPIQPGLVRIVDAEHFANEKLPLTWGQSDEWYNFSNQVGEPIKVLAVVDEATYQGGAMGAVHPISWSREDGKSKFLYTAMGHSPDLYCDKNGTFLKVLLQAVKWVSAETPVP